MLTGGWRGALEAHKAKIMDWDKNDLWEQQWDKKNKQQQHNIINKETIYTQEPRQNTDWPTTPHFLLPRKSMAFSEVKESVSPVTRLWLSWHWFKMT